jgi:hypothetical protein
LQPPFADALEALQEVIMAAVEIISTRINITRFIIVVFSVNKGALENGY